MCIYLPHRRCIHTITYACILGITDDLKILVAAMAIKDEKNRVLWRWITTTHKFFHPGKKRFQFHPPILLKNSHGHSRCTSKFCSCKNEDGIQWHSRRTMSHCDLSPDVDLSICVLTLTESTALFEWTNYIPVATVLNMRDGTKGHFCNTCSTSERNHEN